MRIAARWLSSCFGRENPNNNGNRNEAETFPPAREGLIPTTFNDILRDHTDLPADAAVPGLFVATTGGPVGRSQKNERLRMTNSDLNRFLLKRKSIGLENNTEAQDGAKSNLSNIPPELLHDIFGALTPESEGGAKDILAVSQTNRTLNQAVETYYESKATTIGSRIMNAKDPLMTVWNLSPLSQKMFFLYSYQRR